MTPDARAKWAKCKMCRSSPSIMVVLVWPRTLTSNLFFTIVLDTTPETICMLVAEIRKYKVKSVLSLDKKNVIGVMVNLRECSDLETQELRSFF